MVKPVIYSKIINSVATETVKKANLNKFYEPQPFNVGLSNFFELSTVYKFCENQKNCILMAGAPILLVNIVMTSIYLTKMFKVLIVRTEF